MTQASNGKPGKLFYAAVSLLLVFSMFLFNNPLFAEDVAAVDEGNEGQLGQTGEILPESEDLTVATSTSEFLNASSSAISLGADETADSQILPEGEAANDPLAGNSDTGDESVNVASANLNNETNITNNNNALTYNNSFLRADTGYNQASYNTGSGIITTQNAAGRGELMNVINKNQINLPAGAGYVAEAGNENTGEDSLNLSEVNINNELTIRNINNSNTINLLTTEVNSGKNLAKSNTGHGIILTGNASLGLNFLTMANTNLVGSQRFYANWQNIYNSWIGNIDLSAEAASSVSPLSGFLLEASNRCTGEGSENQAIINVNDEVSIINENSGKIQNQIDAKVVSGRNEASRNTGTGSVTTGDVNASVNVLNFLNSNIISSNFWLKSLNVFGDWKGDLKLPRMPQPNLILGQSGLALTENEETGDGSQNQTDININESVNIDNQNDAVIKNSIGLKTITGENKTSFNGGSGVVKFGEADAETNELNVANLNVTGDSWWMVVVNKFGSWTGTTVGSPEDIEVSGSPNTMVLLPQNSGILAGNDSTGPDSNNLAGVNLNHSTDIANLNEGEIINNLNVEAVSGENEAQYNTGHGYIDTGDVRAANNLINFANANINVGNWLVTVVNVFGNWEGNLIFDCADPENVPSNIGDSIVEAINDETGFNSENNASSTVNNTTDVTNNNQADTSNNSSATSLTGENTANYNTGSGIVSTGGADVTSNIGNQVNNNNTSLDGSGSGSSTQSGNEDTGANSDNQSGAVTNNNTDVTNNNNASTTNDYSIFNNTGQNSADYNTGDGLVDTSWADTYLDVYNQYNGNTLTIGELEDDFVPPENNSGDDSNNNSNGSSQGSDSGNSDSQNNNNGTSGGDSTSGSGSGTTSGSSSGGSTSGSASGSGGSSSGLSYNPTTSIEPTPVKKRGDFNGDGKIDDIDFSILMASWGGKNGDKRADANNDSKVDDFDFSILMAGWPTRVLASKK